MKHLENPWVFEPLQGLASSFRNADPFPYLVIDNFLRPETADAIHDEARSTATNVDVSNKLTQSGKVACTDWAAFGPKTSELIAFFNSGLFLGPIEEITGIDGLIPDPWLEGGGIHLTGRGGFLKMHTDFNWNAKLRADRRINILYYLNRDWQPSWGGELMLSKLGDNADPICVEPKFNRLVIFNTNDTTLHGHPHPLGFPPDYPRASIAMYYYTAGLEVTQRLRNKATTTRYLPIDAAGIDLKQGTMRARLGYLLRRFTRL